MPIFNTANCHTRLRRLSCSQHFSLRFALFLRSARLMFPILTAQLSCWYIMEENLMVGTKENLASKKARVQPVPLQAPATDHRVKTLKEKGSTTRLERSH